jgi:glycosyltransferase involved in cell wall biosynthesis
MSSHPTKELSLAFVYDRVNTRYGGAEVVLSALHEVFPKAPLYTSVYDARRARWAKGWDIKTSFLQKIPGAAQFHRLFLPLMPLAFESLNLKQYDIVFSITSAEAKGILTLPEQLHICYLLTPTRYLWSHTDEYSDDWVTGWLRRYIFRYVRWWDESAAARPDVYIPISRLIAQRCRDFYHRSTEKVIYPPFDLKDIEDVQQCDKIFHPTDLELTEPYYLIVSRLVPYKRIDTAIQVCQELGRNLIIVGEGPDLERLQSLAQSTNPNSKIIFRQAVQPEKVRAYYQNCRAFLLLAEEDFGITALEAQAYGKPVIVYNKSGAAEVIQDGKTGILVHSRSIEEVKKAIRKSEETDWDEQKIRKNVVKHTKLHFQSEIKTKVNELWKLFEQKGKI